MIINGMDEYQKTCRQKLVDWYNKNMPKIYDNAVKISFEDTFIGQRKHYRTINALRQPGLTMVFTQSTHSTAIKANCTKMFMAN